MIKGKRGKGKKGQKSGGKERKNQYGEELCQNLILKGEKKIYFLPISKVTTKEKKYHCGKGGWKNIIFWENI